MDIPSGVGGMGWSHPLPFLPLYISSLDYSHIANGTTLHTAPGYNLLQSQNVGSNTDLNNGEEGKVTKGEDVKGGAILMPVIQSLWGHVD